MSCTACTSSLDERLAHCHEIVVQHVDGRLECAAEHCRIDVRVHRFVVTCTEVDCPECDAPLVEEWDLPLAA
jgi:hypothetical protein